MGVLLKSSLHCLSGVGSLLLIGCDSLHEEQKAVPDDAAGATEKLTATAVGISGPAGETSIQRTNRLREQARTDPNGADAATIDNMSRTEVVATAINSAGFLCARVTRMYPSEGVMVVDCVEFRNGSGRVKYRVDAQAATVEPML